LKGEDYSFSYANLFTRLFARKKGGGLHYCRKVTGQFFQNEIKVGRDITGYDWKVIIDPTRSADDSGLFYGGLFRMVDLRLDRDEKSTWPDGIVFEHKLTGQRLTFEKGILFDLTNNLALVRKPRERIRKGKSLTKNAIQNSTISQMRRFILVRLNDATGISGTGVVAEGAVFTDGLSVIHWLKEPYAMGVYKTLNDVIAVHGHEGGTQLQFIDEGEMTQIP
jgi:hypothetical protein